jgi:hypothetical protein
MGIGLREQRKETSYVSPRHRQWQSLFRKRLNNKIEQNACKNVFLEK